MTFSGKRSEVLPWIVLGFIGLALGRNICHHAGWPWWIGFTAGPAAMILAGAGFNALMEALRGARRDGGSPRSDSQDDS